MVFEAIGVETACTELLKAMGKKTTKAQICSAIEAASSLGISVKLFLIHGFPGENMATTQETIALLKQLKQQIDRVSLFRFVPLPGSYVYRNPDQYNLKLKGDRNSWEDLHIYHNNQHWWGNDQDFQEMEQAYQELATFVELHWPESRD